MRKPRRLADTYHFPGHFPYPRVQGRFGDPRARVLRLRRRGKKLFAALAVDPIGPFTIARRARSGTSPVETPVFIWRSRSGVSCAGAVVW